MLKTKITRLIIQFLLLCIFLFIPFEGITQTKFINQHLTKKEKNWLNHHKNNIKYAPNPSWAPGDYIDNEGIHKGIVSDYIAIFERKLNIKFVEIRTNYWHQIISGLKDSSIDLVGAIQQTEERNHFLLFSDSFLTVPLVLLVKNNFSRSIQNISCVKGYASVDYSKKHFPDAKIIETEDDLAAILKTSLGNADATVTDLLTSSYIVEKYSISNLSMQKELDYKWQLKFACRNEYPELQSIINKLLLSISEKEKQQIYRKWVHLNYIPHSSNNKAYLYFIFLSLTIILILIAIILFINKILKNQIKKKTIELKNELRQKNAAIKLAKKNEERLESIFQISKIKTSTVKELFQVAIEEAIRITESNFGILFLYDANSKEFKYSNSFSKSPAIIDIRNKAFKSSDLGACQKNIIKNKSYTNIECETCALFHSESCLFDSYKQEKTLIIPINTDGQQTDLIILLTNDKINYSESDTKQTILLMKAVWQLVNKQKWQEELIAAREKAEENDKLKSAFLANLSHEIRSPMNGIVGFSQLLQNTSLPQEKIQKFTKIILKSSQYLLSVISDIIEISKIEAGTIKPHYSKINVFNFINELSENILNTLKTKQNVKFILENNQEFKNIEIHTDETKLSQIIVNLVSNAAKFTEKGEIKLKWTLENNSVKFSVQDTGIGIAENYQKIIFERFRQGEDKENHSKGSGLGLAISKAYVEMLGGELRLRSQIDKGSTFYFTIPKNN